MAAITPAPFSMKNCLLTVESDSYEKQVSAVEFVPTSSIINWKGLTPGAVFSDTTAATWVCNLSYAQDWATANSLSRYLHENEGEEIDVTFEPIKDGPSISATLFVTPGSIGGQVDSVAEATVTLGCKAKPTLEALT